MNIQDGPRSRIVITSQDQARRGTAGNNPNEPPTDEELQASGSEAEHPRGSIQVGSRDLRQSSNEVSQYTNTHLDEYPDELAL